MVRNLPIAAKIASVVAIVCVVLVGVGVIGIVQLGETQDRLQLLYVDNLQDMGYLDDTRLDFETILYQVNNLALASEEADVRAAREAISAADAELDAAWAAFNELPAAGDQIDRDTFGTSLTAFRAALNDRVIPMAGRAGTSPEAVSRLRKEQVDPLGESMQQALSSLSESVDRDAQASLERSQRAYGHARLLIIFVTLAAVVLAGLLVMVISRMIARPLRATVGVLTAMAGGDLSKRLDVGGRDEVGRMAEALNTGLERLGSSLREIAANVTQLAAASGQLGEAADRMTGSAARSAAEAQTASRATEEISTSTATVAAGSEEIGASIHEIARSTSDAADTADHAVRNVAHATEVLNKLGDSSRQIETVVNLITSIAEQTNLLALNATIEAARAGEAGKGFAVVATEVKDLAQETARATGDITQRVAAIQHDSAAAATAIHQINQIIATIRDAQTSIAAAVEQQSATTSEMSRTVNQVASKSQQINGNVAAVSTVAGETTDIARGTAETAKDLRRIARQLEKTVSVFQY